jgi:hypothetical protein
MIRSFVMAGVILGSASSFAMAGPVITYDQNGNPSYGRRRFPQGQWPRHPPCLHPVRRKSLKTFMRNPQFRHRAGTFCYPERRHDEIRARKFAIDVKSRRMFAPV